MKASLVALALCVAGTYAGPSIMSIGDWGGVALGGYHEDDEKAVAKAFAAKATELDAQYIVNVGDNFYYYGVWNDTDPQFQTDFENVFTEKSMMVKWYSALGNHDYGFNPAAQLTYKSPNNDRWYMPARYYTKRLLVGGSQYVTYVFLDTNPCISAYRGDDESQWDPCGSTYSHPANCPFHKNILAESCADQMTWLQNVVKQIPADDWVIGVGHHVANEIDVENLMGILIDRNMDLYLNGHAHTLTYYRLNNNGSFVTTGAGCMVSIDGADKEHHAEPDLKTTPDTVSQVWNKKIAGFTSHTFSDDFTQLTTDFWDYQSNKIYSFTITKGTGGGHGGGKSGTCAAYGCGSYNPDNPCQCNSYCKYHGDCCPDYSTTCGSSLRGAN
jgi:hypothetical protein